MAVVDSACSCTWDEGQHDTEAYLAEVVLDYQREMK